jgi:transcriptional/translational regulatory protein YebC/TACO1
VSSTSVALDTPVAARAVLKLIDLLDDYADVDGVYSNFDITDAVLTTVSLD